MVQQKAQLLRNGHFLIIQHLTLHNSQVITLNRG